LLAWKPELNKQDKEGYTPLHLAVKSVEVLESCRPVRALLIKGANPKIKDKKGKTPLDYVNDIDSEPLKAELIHIFEQIQNVKKGVNPLAAEKSTSRNRTTMIAYYILFVIIYLIKFTTTYPR
jgi:ankyrin repeat protein